MIKSKNSIKIVFVLGIYYVLLLWIYKYLISTRWQYQGFVNDSSEENFLYSLIGVSFTIYTFINIHKKNKPSAIIMNFFNLLFFIPMYVFIAFKNIEIGFFLFLILYQLSLFLFYVLKSFTFKPFLFRSKDIFFFILGFVLISNFFITAYYNGFRIKIDLSDVYENRLAAREISMPSILSYIKASAYFVAILALMYALKKKNYVMVIIIVLIQLMSFAFGASKTQFFSIFICFIAFYFYSDKFSLWAPFSLCILLIMSIFEYKFFDSTSINDIWTRRSLFMPSIISYNIYDFFEQPQREFLYLRGSILRIFGFQDPYHAQEGFQRLIGATYGGNDDTNANTGLLGNDYAQLGWFSILFYPFLRIYLLKMLDFCSRGVDKRILVVLSIFISFTYISGAFFTVLLTNALLLVNYLLYTFPKDGINNFYKK